MKLVKVTGRDSSPLGPGRKPFRGTAENSGEHLGYTGTSTLAYLRAPGGCWPVAWPVHPLSDRSRDFSLAQTLLQIMLAPEYVLLTTNIMATKGHVYCLEVR